MPPASSSDRIRPWVERARGAARAAADRAAPLAGALRPVWDDLALRVRPGVQAARTWLAEPANLRRAGRVALPLLVGAGLLLPPISLWTRLTTLGYGKLRPGQDASVAADIDGVFFEARGRSIYRAARVDVSAAGGMPRGVGPLPVGRVQLTPVLSLDIRGPAPREAWIAALVDVGPGGQAFVDPYGWDGQAWQWLPFQFDVANRIRVRLPLQRFVPRHIVITQAARGATEVSAGLLPPPAAPPAAIAEIPILEMRAYGIETDDGHVVGQRFPIPSRRARVYGVVDNLEGLRVRSDLVNNLLMQREARQRHRDALVNLVRRDGLAGIVLDYRGIDGMLQSVYADWLRRLSSDVHRAGGEVFVTVPMPRRTSTAWDGSPYAWHLLAPEVDGVRVLLPIDAPLETEALDAMVRWALGSVPRDKLQLALPVQGRDIVDDTVALIGYGDALAKILDMARSDAPGRIDPDATSVVELPTLRAAQLGRDPATGMWRFYYWDDNRRQHTVWLNDAAGLQPAFEIARTFHLSRIVLDGVEAGLDPNLWQMTQAFIADGGAVAPAVDYHLRWQLVDQDGQVVQQASQSLDLTAFELKAPSRQGIYRLSVNLVTTDDRLAAVGASSEVNIAPAPPVARATPNVLIIVPTPMPVITAPAPADESRIDRAPVRIEDTPLEATAEAGARVAAAEAPLRSEPSVDGDILSTLRIGESLEVIGESPDGDWLEVKVIATGIQGWVLGELIALGGAASDTGALPDDAPAGRTGAVGTAEPAPTARATASPTPVGRSGDRPG